MKHKIAINSESQCVGCRQCQLSCSMVKEGYYAPWLARIKLIKNQNMVITEPFTCQQCPDEPCAAACPVEGVFIRNLETGILYIDENKCIGCKSCVDACPYDMIVFHEEKNAAMKCDLCDGKPACVNACVANVLKVVEVYDAKVE